MITRILTLAYIVWLGMLRRKDLYVLFILLAAMLLLLVSLNIFGLGTVTGYVADIGLLMTWGFSWAMAIGASARELPQEESRRTIFPLLAKPVRRGEVIIGKWLGAWTIVCVATAAFYGLVALIVAAGGGPFAVLPLLQALLLHASLLGFITAAGVLLSTRLNFDAAATLTGLLTAAAFLVVPRIPAFLSRESGPAADALLALYFLLPHGEVFDMRRRLVHGLGPAPAGAVAGALLYGALLTAGCLFLAWLAYRRKRFLRGSLG